MYNSVMKTNVSVVVIINEWVRTVSSSDPLIYAGTLSSANFALQMFDYVAVSGRMDEGRMIEHVAQQHEHFLHPVTVRGAR